MANMVKMASEITEITDYPVKKNENDLCSVATYDNFVMKNAKLCIVVYC